ncbi:hypothetical protein HDU96_005111 [Phlyctochytrium bullatum]|nr:hypothetical protein HDU96_005111 [Phlyctochytrium bullatum]
MTLKNTLSAVIPAASSHSNPPVLATPPPPIASVSVSTSPRDSAVSVSPHDGTITLPLHHLQQLVDTAVANQVATLRSQVHRESQRIGEQIDELEREVSARLERQVQGKRARRGRVALNKKFKARAGGKSASSAEPAATVDAEAAVPDGAIKTANERTPAAPAPCPQPQDAPTTGAPGPARLPVDTGPADLAAVPTVDKITENPPAAPSVSAPAQRPACTTNARNRITHAPNCNCPLSMQEIWIELFVKDPATRWPQHKESSKRVTWAENVVSQVFTWSDGDEEERTASALWHIREGAVNDLLVDVVDAGFEVAGPWLDLVGPFFGFEDPDEEDELRLGDVPVVPGFDAKFL